MEEEYFLSGYCRQIDGSRMVSICVENGSLTDADCSFGSCIYESSCPVAAEIRSHLQAEK